MTLPTDAQVDERLARLADTLPASLLAHREVVTPQPVRPALGWSTASIIGAVAIVVLLGVALSTARPSTDVRVGALASADPSPKAAPSSPDVAAVEACEAIKGSVPLVLLRSGEPTVVGAYTMDAAGLGAYLGTVQAGVNPVTVLGPAAEGGTVVCIIDGDFDTRTPGPPGHDTTAKRILVLVRDGTPELRAIAHDPAAMPTPDDLVASGGPSTPPGPTASGSGAVSPDGIYLLASHPGGDCGGEGDTRPARIRAAESDPDHVWLELDGERLTALWPEGTTVRFAGDGTARIRDADGTVIARVGQRLRDTSLRGCMSVSRGRVLMYPG